MMIYKMWLLAIILFIFAYYYLLGALALVSFLLGILLSAVVTLCVVILYFANEAKRSTRTEEELVIKSPEIINQPKQPLESNVS